MAIEVMEVRRTGGAKKGGNDLQELGLVTDLRGLSPRYL
jgi:hypothetical protein